MKSADEMVRVRSREDDEAVVLTRTRVRTRADRVFESKKYPPLSFGEFLSLFTEWKEHGSRAAYEKLVTHNTGLCRAIARKYLSRGIPFEDLVQEGVFGVMRALEKFDPERGLQFSTYASHWVNRHILKYLVDHGRMIRFPAAHQTNMWKVLHAIEGLLENNMLPNEQRVAEITGLPITTTKRVLASLSGDSNVVSLETSVGRGADDSDLTIGDTIEGHTYVGPQVALEARGELREIRRKVEGLLRVVIRLQGMRDAGVLCLRYGINPSREKLTLEAVAERYGLTRERVRQVTDNPWKKHKGKAEITSQDELEHMLSSLSDLEELCGEEFVWPEDILADLLSAEEREAREQFAVVCARIDMVCATVREVIREDAHYRFFCSRYGIGGEERIVVFGQAIRKYGLMPGQATKVEPYVWQCLAPYSKHVSRVILREMLKRGEILLRRIKIIQSMLQE